MKQVQVIEGNGRRIDRSNAKVIERYRVAVYCRVSTDSEEQLLSYNSQVAHYKQHVDKNPIWDLVDIYADEGISGTQTAKRLEFQRMINDALAGRIDLIITKSISRFARNTLDTLKYVRMLKENDVAILFEKENIDTMTMNGEMLLTILSSLAQQESESISSNVKMGLKMKMKRGEMVGFNGCLGYDYDPETKSIAVNQNEAEIIRHIFNRYIEGVGCFVIAKELTQLGYKTKRGNAHWLDGAVRKIINNEKYKGDLLLGKTFTIDAISHRRLANMGEENQYYISNHHEPIISEDMFMEAQRILRKRSDKHNNKGRLEKYSRKYAFSSMIKCAYCGGTASRRIWHSNSEYDKPIWQCTVSSKKGKKACPESKGLDEVIIEKAFVHAFNMLCNDNKEIVEDFLVNTERSLESSEKTQEIRKVDKAISAGEKKLGKLVDLRLEDTIDNEVYETKHKELAKELEKFRLKKNDLTISADEEISLKKRMVNFRKLFEKNESLESFDREVFESIIEEVILGSKDDDGNINPHRLTFVFKTGLGAVCDVYKKRGDANDEMFSHYTPDTFRSNCEVRKAVKLVISMNFSHWMLDDIQWLFFE